jgi:hypothetical protein
MSSGTLRKVDMLSRVFKMKNSLHDGKYSEWSIEQRTSADHMLNKVLDVLDEYSQ